jgi:hypothetical protein
MEVFIVSTPTYSGNYKAILESLRVQPQRHATAFYGECKGYKGLQEKGLALNRDAQLLPHLNIGGWK